MDSGQEQALRDRTAHLALDWRRETDGDFTGEEPRAFLPLVEAAHVIADEARLSLGRWANAGRRAGLSWAEIGAAIGVSKQAAQQRFGVAGDDGPEPEGALVVRLGATAFNEVAILKREGREGRELIATGLLRLFFRQTDRAWEHLRTVGALAPHPQVTERWELVSVWLPFHYYKRPA